MSKRPFKSQASSARAVSGAFGGPQDGAGFGVGFSTSSFGAVTSSPLSYVYEPPDLSGLSEPNIVVAFKNIQKKDATTKAKALEDIQSYILSLESRRGQLEDAMLEAWIKVYPRSSIDTSRRVRQLAHTVQGQIAISCGKRIAKHLPAIVPPWLAGQHDNDKSVSRSANESFNSVFGSDDKKSSVWRLYQATILEFARDVIVKETTSTLSDERTVSPDDASAKYSRVVGASVMVVSDLIENTPKPDLEKSKTLIGDFLKEANLWKLAFHEDPYVRRAIYKLLVVALAKEKEALDPSMLSVNMLTSGLHISQAGSALDYARAVAALSTEIPDVWTVHYIGSGKKSPQNRICHFLKRGSQGGSAEFWAQVSRIITVLPPKIIVNTANESGEVENEDEHTFSPVLSAIREGLNSRGEVRANQGAAWSTYLDVFELVLSSFPAPPQKQRLYQTTIFPLVTQHIRKSPDQSRWVISGPQQGVLCTRACAIAILRGPEEFLDGWKTLSSKVIEDLKTSLPEQSKEFAISQDAVSSEMVRWYRLQASVLKSNAASSIGTIIGSTLPLEVRSIISLIKTRNGKPYGAASALESLIQVVPASLLHDNSVQEELVAFANIVPNFIVSPSAQYLIRVLSLLQEHNILEGQTDIGHIYERCMSTLIDAPDSPAKAAALQSFISSPRLGDTESLSTVVMNDLSQAMKDDTGALWEPVMAAMANPQAPKRLTDDILANMTAGLSLSPDTTAAINGLEKIAWQNNSLLKDFILSSTGSTLRSKLLLLADSANESVSLRARNLDSTLERMLSVEGEGNQATKSMIAIVNEGLEKAVADSLSIDALVDQAQKLIEKASPTDLPAVANELLPSATQWGDALAPFITRSPNESLAITNPIGGALFLLLRSPDPSKQKISWDADGYSSAFRMARYATKLILSTDCFSHALKESKVVTCKAMATFLQLAGDDLSVNGSPPLWELVDPDLESEVVDFVAEAQALLASWLTLDCITDVQKQLLYNTAGRSTTSYYNARAYSALMIEIAELQGAQVIRHSDVGQLKQLRQSPDVFTSAALLTSVSDSKETLKLCNGLLADLTGQQLHEKSRANKVTENFVFLNLILYQPEDYVNEVPQQRLVFFVKHVVKQMQHGLLLIPSIGGEIMKTLCVVLPAIKEIYDDFWADILEAIPQVWLDALSDEFIYGIYSSLRLLSLLKKADMQQSNDDLLDAWTEKKERIAKGLVGLMVRLQDVPDESHQPRRIVNDILGRTLANLSQHVSIDIEELYPVLASESAAFQQAAYELLHTQIPNAQEQVSIDKALSKDFVAQVPQELLSLILAPPSLDILAEHNFERTIAPPLRSYLLSWKLTFDHWQNASYKVQADYVAALKEGTYLQEFLSFTLNILITARSHPIDASKFDIETYTPNTSESPEQETHWLLIHLYYLSLRYVPSLSKEWWRDNAPRQLNIAAETWTQKYISPLIISSELSTISAWGPTQATDDQPMTIKVSPSAREITASIPIDEQTMSISVRLPPSYPLARAEVKSIHRVGVAEKKWQSWLINAQGVMNLSSGSAGEGSSLIDGLVAWRKNVSAAMKGQTECAICYSVVSGDRQLPSKRCSTCKNMFHSSCLFRWFRSSNSSSCPLCRNSFNYS